MPRADFVIISTQPYVYLDAAGRVVDGYRVFFTLPSYNETHYVNVPSLAPTTVNPAIERIITDRRNLSTQ